MDKFKAAILVESCQPLIIDEIESNKLQFGQVKVEMICSGICGAQINEIDAIKGPDKFLPHLMGHEGVGTVIEIGDGVSKVKKGDRVVLHWRKSKGIESNFPSFNWNGAKVGAGLVTAFNEYSIVSENRITKISHSVHPPLAALLGCSTTTALGIMSRELKFEIGQSILITGAGGLGLSLAQAAKMVSANPIVLIDKYAEKENLALNNGADYFFSTDIDTLSSKLPTLIGSKGFDICIDTTGNVELINHLFGLLNNSGKLLLVGQPNVKDKLVVTKPLDFFSDKMIFASDGGLTNPDIDIPRYVRLIESNKINIQPIITHNFDLCDINEGIKVMRSGKAGRVIINNN